MVVCCLLLGLFCKHGGNLRGVGLARYFIVLTAVEGSDISTATTNISSLTVGHRLLRGRHLRRAICAISPSEQLANERVDIDAEVEPAVPLDHDVRDPGVHLVNLNCLCSIAEHQPSPRLHTIEQDALISTRSECRRMAWSEPGTGYLHCACRGRLARFAGDLLAPHKSRRSKTGARC